MVARSGALSPGLDHTTLPAQWGGGGGHTHNCLLRSSRNVCLFLSFLPFFLLFDSIIFPLVINFFHFSSSWFAYQNIELEACNSQAIERYRDNILGYSA